MPVFIGQSPPYKIFPYTTCDTRTVFSSEIVPKPAARLLAFGNHLKQDFQDLKDWMDGAAQVAKRFRSCFSHPPAAKMGTHEQPAAIIGHSAAPASG
jgi:hypothetical protein